MSRATVNVADYLAGREGTIADIMAATGYARTTVEHALGMLREDRDLCLANLRRLRPGPRAGIARISEPSPPSPRLIAPEGLDIDAVHRRAPANQVAKALDSRTPLEQAWGERP